MISFVLQDWTTVAVGSALTQYVQREEGWLDVAAWKDVSLWLDTQSVQTTMGADPQIFYETSPVRDADLFQAMATVTLDATPAANPAVTNLVLDRNPSVPLGRWLRWTLDAGGTQSARWGARFRIVGSAMPVGRI